MGVREVAATDDDAIYASLAPELLRFATALVGRDDAQDVVSIAVVKSLASPAWNTVTNHRSYLFRAVFNECQRWSRRVLLRRDREARSASSDRWELPDYRPEVRSAVDALSIRQRAVIVLTYWHDLDPAAIADQLDISEGSVRRHLARGRARLREVLHDD
jgi:RNA polymerase sigma factor (sigma-70 family)